jgi:uncharacterized protein (DUF1499 family)
MNDSEKPSKSACRIRNTALALLILLPVAALGTRFGLWPFIVGFIILAVSILGSAVILLINLVWNFRKPSTADRKIILLTSLMAMIPLLVIILAISNRSGGDAIIHDISTDLTQVPEFVAGVVERGEDSNSLQHGPEKVKTQQQVYSDIKAIITPLPPAEAFQKALLTSRKLGWDVYAEAAGEGRIEAVDTTFWFGFKDDIVIRINSQGEGSRIDLRSVSRVGQSDLGANAKRIHLFIETFDQL